MKVVTTVKNGWFAQSNSAQLNWPSFEASLGVSRLGGLQANHSGSSPPRMAAGRRDKTPVIGQQRGIQRSRPCHDKMAS